MKAILFFAALALSSTSFANSRTVLTCRHPMHHMVLKMTTSNMILIDDKTGKKGQIYEIQDLLPREEIVGTAVTVVAQKVDAALSHGTLEDALMLRIFDGRKHARLALHGSVYILNCK